MTGKYVRLSVAACLAAAAVIVAPALVHAADSAKEAATAAKHAGFAAKAPTLAVAHKHLHHVVNCLVGPNGMGFDKNEANPCAKLGNGAIPDTTDSAMKTILEDALKTANAGLASSNLATVHKDAAATAATLGKVNSSR